MTTTTMTNRHGDEIHIGQLWTDDPRRDTRRTLHVDSFQDAGSLGTQAVCTVIRAHNTTTGEITEPGRVVAINIDSLHTTAGGNGYRLAEPADEQPVATA